MLRPALLLLTLAAAASVALCLDNGAARTPPMGWMTWNAFRCATSAEECAKNDCISHDLLTSTADALVSTGLAGAGYTIVALDDCWAAAQRGADGGLLANATRFPGGIAAAADAVRARGLQFGIYTDLGAKTCAGYPGSAGHFETDAALFAALNASFVKADGCGVEADDLHATYVAFGRALAAATAAQGGAPIAYSCSWPAYLPLPPADVPYAALRHHCNLWRNWVDVDTNVASIVGITRWFAHAAHASQIFASTPRPGAWHDPDQLLLGDGSGRVPWSVQALQFAVWSVTAAPLFLSADVRTMDAAAVALASHPAIVAINQDGLGAAPVLLHAGVVVAWARRLVGGRAAVVAANTGKKSRELTLRVPRSVLRHGSGDLCWREIDLTQQGVLQRRWMATVGGRTTTIALPPLTARLFLVAPCDVERPGSTE